MTELAPRPWTSRPGVVVTLCTLAYLPFTLLGYGTDIDVANVLRAGRLVLDEQDYEMSRGPGAAIHEVGTAALDRVGGSVLVNLVSLAFAAVALWAVFRLVERDGGRWPAFATLLLATNPWFWIAATSLGDFTWALGLLLAGVVAARADRRLVAGLLFGLAVGCRASTALLVAAWLLAEWWPGARGRPSLRAVVSTGLVALVVGVLCFVPPWLDAGRTLDFLESELEFAGLRVHGGRWLVKNVAVVGLLPAVVLVATLPRWVPPGLRRWRTSAVVRFAALAVVATEVLFLRFPFKPAHLLPMVAGLAIVVASSERMTRSWLWVLVAAQLVSGLVGVTVARPDVADAAAGGRVDVSVVAGPLVSNVRCRLDDRELGPWPDPAQHEATVRAGANATCQNEAWRGG